MPDRVRTAADAALVETLASMVAGHRVIAAYVPVAGEPGGASLPAALAAATTGERLLLPVVRPDLDLDWAYYAGPDSMAITRRGLLEPTGPRLGLDGIARVDLVVVPALAVDRRGIRLGRGGGCYDRALVRVPAGIELVTPLYAGELHDDLPAEPHDRRVDTALVADGPAVLVWHR